MPLECRLEAVEVDAEAGHALARHARPAGLGALHRLAAAISHKQPPVDVEFVATRVATEIIVVVQDQDPQLRICPAQVVRAREAPDAGTDDDVVVLGDGLPAEVVAPAIAHAVCDREVRGPAAAVARARRGIGGVGLADTGSRSDPGRHDRAGHAIEEVAARDALIHRLPRPIPPGSAAQLPGRLWLERGRDTEPAVRYE